MNYSTNLDIFAADPAAASGPERTPALGRDVQGEILIVDDVADNRTILARRFQRLGFHVREAESGLEALDIISSHAFDVVLLDVMMPGIDGLETLRRIRLDRDTADLPVVMITAKSQSGDVVEAINAGANDYVTKPVDFPVALARVQAQVGRKRAEEEVRRVTEQLRDANFDLEERVAERTAKLTEANERLVSEIAERQRSEAESWYLANHDLLTGLANRGIFERQLRHRLADAGQKGDSIAVHFLDIDGFKCINDTYGHAVGDKLLRSIANDLTEVLTDGEEIARFGGDEFAIVSASADLPGRAACLAARCIQLISQPRMIDDHRLAVGVSIGIVVSTPTDRDSERLLQHADLAMYRAKEDGRGTYRFFEPEMDERARSQRRLEAAMRIGLSEEQFEVYYQPFVNIADRRITGFEALVRWNHPEMGLVSPADFIPLAESTGLIVPLGDWVLRQACAEALKWPGNVKVAVNLSTIQFRNNGIVAAVENALAATGLPASRLELEITESVLLENTDTNLQVLHALKALGVTIAMDDFGTGYSSLGYLQNFHFDKIKIDQVFIRGMSAKDDSRAIIRAVASLGSSLGMRTIAEGVETLEQLAFVGEEGCNEAQGYLFSRPVPASEIAAMIQRLHEPAAAD